MNLITGLVNIISAQNKIYVHIFEDTVYNLNVGKLPLVVLHPSLILLYDEYIK